MNFPEILAKITTPPVPAIVVAVVAVLLILYVYIAKAINSKKKDVAPAKTSDKKDAPVASATNKTTGVAASSGNLELVGTDEKTAAVIMAIVSDKSGIPLNRLQFKSITLMEDK